MLFKCGPQGLKFLNDGKSRSDVNQRKGIWKHPQEENIRGSFIEGMSCGNERPIATFSTGETAKSLLIELKLGDDGGTNVPGNQN